MTHQIHLLLHISAVELRQTLQVTPIQVPMFEIVSIFQFFSWYLMLVGSCMSRLIVFHCALPRWFYQSEDVLNSPVITVISKNKSLSVASNRTSYLSRQFYSVAFLFRIYVEEPNRQTLAYSGFLQSLQANTGLYVDWAKTSSFLVLSLFQFINRQYPAFRSLCFWFRQYFYVTQIKENPASFTRL